MSLYRVVYHRSDRGFLAGPSTTLLDHKVYDWLDENCQGTYYRSPAWTGEKFIEFELSEDATLFALKWAV